jgi:ribonucleoside-diphosphate reductase alpha chain
MSRPELFDPELLEEMAQVAVDTNAEVAALIGINTAARVTCGKPSGNSAAVLGTTSGPTPEHSPQFFRVAQVNKESEVAKYLEVENPEAIEESVYSANRTDYAVFCPCVAPEEAIFKKEMKDVKHLELLKLIQEHWVLPGTRPERGYHPSTRHNISNTVIVTDYDAVGKYLFENQDMFTAVSFLSEGADLDFNQAPFTAVLTPEEILDKYGEGSMFASGLIVDGLHQFDMDLWGACELVKHRQQDVGGNRWSKQHRKDWIAAVKRFARNYFDGDLDTAIYCIKDVHLRHKWNTILRKWKNVDFGKILTKPSFKDVSDYAAQACSGGACEI